MKSNEYIMIPSVFLLVIILCNKNFYNATSSKFYNATSSKFYDATSPTKILEKKTSSHPKKKIPKLDGPIKLFLYFSTYFVHFLKVSTFKHINGIKNKQPKKR